MSKFSKDLIESLTEAVEHAEGKPAGVRTHVVEVPDVRAIRRQLRMSQQEFAHAYRIPLATLKNWEQGRRQPDAPAAAYLQVIAKHPREAREALAACRRRAGSCPPTRAARPRPSPIARLFISSFPRKREPRDPGSRRSPWVPAFAGATAAS